MRTRDALLVVATGGMVGLLTGAHAAAAGTRFGGKLVALEHWAHLPATPSEQLEAQLADIQKRTNELQALQTRLDALERQVNGSDGGHAYAEAKRLGILDAVARMQPDLRPSAIRRMGVALVSEAEKNDLDPLLLAALARVESGFNPFATSEAGARGLLQLTPPTGKILASMDGIPLGGAAQLYDIETNISLGARYLAQLLQQFDSIDVALLAYNRGAGGARAVLKSPDGAKALAGYPHSVLQERARLAHKAKKLQASTAL